MNNVVLTIKITSPPGKREDIIRMIRSLLGPAQANEACICCSLYQDVADESVLLLKEVWESREVLEKHIRNHQLNVLLTVIDLSVRQPDVQFDTVNTTEGLEFLSGIKPPRGEHRVSQGMDHSG